MGFVHSDDAPSQACELIEPVDIARVLSRVEAMPFAVVLEQHAMGRVDEVAERDPPPVLIVDLAVGRSIAVGMMMGGLVVLGVTSATVISALTDQIHRTAQRRSAEHAGADDGVSR